MKKFPGFDKIKEAYDALEQAEVLFSQEQDSISHMNGWRAKGIRAMLRDVFSIGG